MDIDVTYAVKYFFPTPTFVQIYFEAVANAFDAGATTVTIHISASGKNCTTDLEITISDDGVGLTDERFARFRRLTEPVDPYHKGLGRLVYLHYFHIINVTSTFGATKRTLSFSTDFNGSSEKAVASPSDQPGTVLRFSGFRGQRLSSYDVIKPGALKATLLAHFLPLFHEHKKAGKDFRIAIETQVSGPQKDFISDYQTITPADIPVLEHKTLTDNTVDLFASISMYYAIRPEAGAKSTLTAAACVDGRTIPFNNLLNLTAIPPHHSVIFLFESQLFTGRSDTARQRLVLPDNVPEPTLRRLLRREMSAVLNERLPDIVQKNKRTREEVEKKYPHLTGLFEEDTVGLIDRDEAIEIAQRRFFIKQKEVLESNSLDDATFEKSLEVSSRALTEYILYRELIIAQLRAMNPGNAEEHIHKLIVPMRARFHGHELTEGIYSNNAWLLDDKFMGFRTILSDERMRDLISAITLKEGVSRDEGRPDIALIFSADPKDAVKVEVVVVELKKRDSSVKDSAVAAAQLLQRARKLADHCPAIQRMWYFGIIEVDSPLREYLVDDEWTPLFSKGTVFYKERKLTRDDGSVTLAPTYMLSYEAVIEDAARRNHTFLEILKSGLKKAQPVQQNDGKS